MLGEYRPPNQINKDEDKYGYGRIAFTKIQIVYGVIGLLLGLLLFAVLSLTGAIFFKILGGILAVVATVGGTLIGGLTFPARRYLNGGGLRIDQYLIRKAKKKFLKRYHVVYTRNVDRDRLVSYRTVNIKNTDEKPSLLQDIKQMFGGE